MSDQTVLIAMSGGVDSSAACLLLKNAGYTCRGLTMRLTGTGSKDEQDAAAVAEALGIPHEVADLSSRFRELVIEPFVSEYEQGLTPNPCVRCNRTVKFGELLKLADERGLRYLATGHYARVVREDGRYLLKKGRDPEKDQSYVLYSLTQEQLARVTFPLGDYTKQEIRELTAEAGFANAGKKESQDICFIPDGDYAAFIEDLRGCPLSCGDFLDTRGEVLGQHRGMLRYTKGQRKGLGLALGTPVYVLDKSPEENTVTVGPEADLFEREADLICVNYIPFDSPPGPIRVTAATRYRKKEAPATVRPTGEGTCTITFDEPQRAMTRGQSVVFYDGDLVVGGGIISATRK